MKFKYRSSIYDENLVSKFRCAIGIRYTSDFEDLVWKKCKEYFTKYWLRVGYLGYTGLNILKLISFLLYFKINVLVENLLITLAYIYFYWTMLLWRALDLISEKAGVEML